MGRTAGAKNRNYPNRTLEQALVIPTAIQDKASGMAVTKLTLARLVDSTPGSSTFRSSILAARAYGLSDGGVNSDEFSLTKLGIEATSEDDSVKSNALRRAVMNVEPFKAFFQAFEGKKVPSDSAFSEFLVTKQGVPETWAEDCMQHLISDARFVGFLTDMKGSEYVTSATTESPLTRDQATSQDELTVDISEGQNAVRKDGSAQLDGANGDDNKTLPSKKPKSIFVAHGKDKKPLEQLKNLLTELGVPFKVAVDEPHGGRPIGEKVASMMHHECSSAICIFSADERFLRQDKDGNQSEVWRPSENAVYELGAASVLYGRRLILFKEDKVTLPSDFRDIGHITFKKEEIPNHMLELLRELKAHGLVEVVVPS